ncbi:Sensor protein EvgS [Thalassocella blandensis]|nr:Sensor protein EvgS [Thalassocella blandensis]
MGFDNVTVTALFSAAVLSFVLTATFFYQAIKNRLHWWLGLAAAFQTLWLGVLAGSDLLAPFNSNLIFLAESLHYISWLFAINMSTEKYCATSLPLPYKIGIYLISGGSLLFAVLNLFTHTPLATQIDYIIWQGTLFSIACLLSIEQLYRNITHFRLIKLICLGLAIMFVFDAYLFTQHLVSFSLDSSLWQTRAAVYMAASAIMIMGVGTTTQPSYHQAKINFSRPIIFYTTSVTIAGSLLVLLAIGGYYVRLYGGDWGTVIYTLILVIGLCFLMILFTSTSLRKNLSVLIDKHLFSYKYDYRSEWLKLISQLSQPSSPIDTATRAIKVAADLFDCDGGALWLARAKVLVPVRQINTTFDISETFEPENSEFCVALADQWVYAPNSTPNTSSTTTTYTNDTLPNWMAEIDNVWLIFPLLTENNLVGFILLTRTDEYAPVSWEDLDLAKTVGRQIASYLTRHEQAERLAESRQFDAFNKLSAFVMHDLKNLIAQQTLVVKNAEKHKDNPAFIEDAINTISNSVVRMNSLLRKLQRSEPEETKILKLNEVIIESIKRSHKLLPAPTIEPISEEILVRADFDSLVMVFTHIVHNAQDATSNDGFIDITTNTDSDIVTVTIEDNGCGMDDEFIRSKLFKPFETTKSGKGMGVGVYQAREYLQNIGGGITVESSPGVGTTFIITIPRAG